MRIKINPLDVEIYGSFFGLENDEKVKGKIIALESYAENALTFTFQSLSGHLYTYLPLDSIVTKNTYSLNDLTDFNCYDYNFSLCDLQIDDSGWGLINNHTFQWKKYIITIDWYLKNRLVHLVKGWHGEYRIIQNSKFQIGGDQPNFPSWKKNRGLWKV